MFKKTLIAVVCLLGLSACGSIPTQNIQTDHVNFSIPSYRQKTADNERQDHSTPQTGSMFVEYISIASDSNFADFVQANMDTLRQNLGTQLKGDITQSSVNISCSGSTITGSMVNFSIDQDEDVLYLSQIFTIHDTAVTAISVASFSSDIRSETSTSIADSIVCKL